jgi:hypothetical protein
MSGSRPWTPEDADRLRALVEEAKRTLTFAAKELMRTEYGWAGLQARQAQPMNILKPEYHCSDI